MECTCACAYAPLTLLPVPIVSAQSRVPNLRCRMNPQVQTAKPEPAPSAEEKRKYQRYRFINNIYVCKQNGSWHRAMTYEISLGGISVAMVTELSVGEIVRLSPIAGKEVYAVVRRRKGTMYGFEFLKLSTWLREQIQKICEKLPPFTSLADV
jgi:hypothetical protein